MISGSGKACAKAMHAPPASVRVVDLAVLARVNPVAVELRLRSKLSPELSDTYQGQRLMENESAYRITCRLIPVTDFSVCPAPVKSPVCYRLWWFPSRFYTRWLMAPKVASLPGRAAIPKLTMKEIPPWWTSQAMAHHPWF